MGEHGNLRFPYHLRKHELDLRENTAFQRLAMLVKQSIGLKVGAPRLASAANWSTASRIRDASCWGHCYKFGSCILCCILQEVYASTPKVVIAVRSKTRIISNAPEIARRLQQEGMDVHVVNFGKITFEEQVCMLCCIAHSSTAASLLVMWPCVRPQLCGTHNDSVWNIINMSLQVKIVHDAAALVTLHGADCMNLMFLPLHATIVEIDPVHYGYGYRTVMRKGDYFNIARMLGKYHLE